MQNKKGCDARSTAPSGLRTRLLLPSIIYKILSFTPQSETGGGICLKQRTINKLPSLRSRLPLISATKIHAAFIVLLPGIIGKSIIIIFLPILPPNKITTRLAFCLITIFRNQKQGESLKQGHRFRRFSFRFLFPHFFSPMRNDSCDCSTITKLVERCAIPCSTIRSIYFKELFTFAFSGVRKTANSSICCEIPQQSI